MPNYRYEVVYKPRRGRPKSDFVQASTAFNAKKKVVRGLGYVPDIIRANRVRKVKSKSTSKRRC